METIEPKERERIESKIRNSVNGNDNATFSAIGAAKAEHLHLQNTVIEPLAKSGAGYKMLYDDELQRVIKLNDKLEAENKELKESNARISENFAALQIRFGESETENKELKDLQSEIWNLWESMAECGELRIGPKFLANYGRLKKLLTKNEGL